MSSDEFNKASKKVQIASPYKMGELDVKLKEIRLNKKEQLTKQRAQSLGLPYANLSNISFTEEALRVVTKEEAEKYKIICFLYSNKEISLGVVDPENKDSLFFVKKLKDQFFNKNVVVYLISENSFQKVLSAYAKLPEIKDDRKGVKITEKDIEKFSEVKRFDQLADYIKKISTTEVLALLLSSGINLNASDIHIETESDQVKIRFRIDGMLHDVTSIPKDRGSVLSSRIKLVSGLKINVSDIPQDGSFVIFIKDEQVDVRISTLPTAYGESIVIRLLAFSKQDLTLEEIGLTKENAMFLEKGMERPNGMILNTGPTGSGKTTTLYSILKKLNKEGTKIITIEDPIEYHLKGINQSNVDIKKGYTFSVALRSIVRQDPDVIMVGEIRDSDTVDTAIQAALTGHLVLSTVHTNSAPGAVPRLISMEAKNFLLAPALNTVIGQRLVRRVCKHCKTEIKISDKDKSKIKEIFKESAGWVKEKINIENIDQYKFYKGKGCDVCGGIGYKGRIGIFEIINVNERIRNVIVKNENISEDELRKVAIKEGMSTMAQDGILKAIEGETSLEEVFRVT